MKASLVEQLDWAIMTLEETVVEAESLPAWPKGIFLTVRGVRQANPGMSLTDAIMFISNLFGFPEADRPWREVRQWFHDNQIDLTLARGPYVVTILKAIAAKHDRTNVSTLSSE